MVSRTATRPVVVHGRHVRVDRAWSEVPAAEAGHRFGGLQPLAALAGGLAGLGAAALLGTVAAAVLDRPGALTAGVAAAVLALVGGSLAGWVAARVARYDGTRNGLLAGIALVLLAAGTVAAGLAARDTGAVLPGHLTAPRATAASLAAGAIAVVAAALAGAAGGRWHRQVDDVLLRTRAGGVSPYPEEAR